MRSMIIDERVLQLISERARIAHRIGEIKHGNIYRPEREAQVLRRLADTNPGPIARPGGQDGVPRKRPVSSRAPM